MPELAQIAHWLAIAEHGSFTAAARALHLSQPALTAQIKRLEAELGLALLVRTHEGAQLSAAGLGLEPYARTLMRAHAEFERRAEQARAGRGGPLRIGCSAVQLATRLGPVLGAFVAAQPEIELAPLIAGSQAVAAAVEAGAIELGLVSTPPARGALLSEALYRDAFAWVRGALATARTDTLVTIAAGSGLRRFVDGEVARAELHFASVVEVEGIEAARSLAEVGIGVTLLPRIACREALAAGRLLNWPTAAEPGSRTTYLLQAARAERSPLAQRFAKALRAAFQAVDPGGDCPVS